MEEMDETSVSTFIPKTSVGYLIQKLMVMCKKPSLEADLSGVLDEYLKKLQESQIYLSNGIFTTNFAEAALLIDNAVLLYSKKIDILWDNIFDYQKQILSYERKSEKTRQAELQLEERRQKYKRRKKKIEKEDPEVIDETAMDCLIENIVKQLDEDLMVSEELTFEDDVHLMEHFDEVCTKFLPKQTATKPFAPYNRAGFVTMSHPIYGDDGEIMCDNNYLSTERALFLLSEHMRQIAYNLYKKRNIELIGYDVKDKLLQQFIVEKNIVKLQSTREMSLLVNSYVKLQFDLRRKQDVGLEEEHKNVLMRRTSILLTRLPDSVIKQYLKKDDADGSCSVAQSETVAEQSKGSSQEGKINLNNETPVHENREGDSGFLEGSFLGDVETRKETISVDASKNFDCSFSKVVTSMPEHSSIRRTSQTPSEMLELRPRKRKLQNSDEVQKPKRVLSRRPKPFKWLPTTTVKLKTFERFYHLNYEPEAEEGQIPEQKFSDTELDDGNENSEILSSTEVAVQSEPQDIAAGVSQPVEAEPSTSTETESKSKLVDFMELIRAREAEQAPYFEWKTFIERKIAANDKTEFDIHKFGTDILNRLPEKKPTHFSNLMKGKKSSDVVRYFIASLQLANTYNIELTHPNGAQLGNDSLKLKLLSMERYHENLSAYHAPSEINLPKKLARIRDLTASMSTGAATSSKGCKRRKLND